MNTRSRFTLSTVLSLTLAGFCIGSAQAQNSHKEKTHHDMNHEAMMDEYGMDAGTWPQPVPINYPFSAPGGLHLFHWTDYSMDELAPESSYMKTMDNRYEQDKMLHERLTRAESMMSDEEKKMQRVPAPINYPFSAPGGLHLFHWTDYSMEELAPESSYMKTMDNRYEQDKMLHERLTRAESMMSDEEKELMTVPAPINYPFAAPGGVHLYHYTDYSREDLREGSAAMEHMNRMEKREKREKERKRERMSK